LRHSLGVEVLSHYKHMRVRTKRKVSEKLCVGCVYIPCSPSPLHAELFGAKNTPRLGRVQQMLRSFRVLRLGVEWSGEEKKLPRLGYSGRLEISLNIESRPTAKCFKVFFLRSSGDQTMCHGTPRALNSASQLDQHCRPNPFHTQFCMLPNSMPLADFFLPVVGKWRDCCCGQRRNCVCSHIFFFGEAKRQNMEET
jgi:hypothetical protein